MLDNEPYDEEALGRMLCGLAPLVAFARPGSRRTIGAGAARFSISDDLWERTLLDILPLAALVILQVGTSNALMWEAQIVLRSLSPRKILIFLATDDAETLRICVRQIESLVGLRLPPLRINKTVFICFDDDWTPHIFERSGFRNFLMSGYTPFGLPRDALIDLFSRIASPGIASFCCEEARVALRALSWNPISYARFFRRACTTPEESMRASQAVLRIIRDRL